MKKQYIKVPIPEAISEDGGASILFVNKQTVPLDGAIAEALAGNYCTGQATLIRNFFFGLMQSMADGVRRDGHARQIANFLTVYPVFKGEVDMDYGYNPDVNGVMIRARLLNEMELDISDWSFDDATEGKRSFKLTSCSTGEVDGEYRVGELGHVNGKDLPSTAAGEELRVHWEVEGTDKSGDIPATKLSSEIDRIDIAADALAELDSADYDGKTIVFTVRGNFSSAKISAKLKYAAPPLEATWDGTLKTNGGEITVGGTVGRQLAEIGRADPAKLYERFAWYDQDGQKMTSVPPYTDADDGITFTIAIPEDYPASEHVGETFTFKVKAENTAGELVEFSHGFVMTAA